jgi:hypothetical protein
MTDIKIGMFVTRNPKAPLWKWWEGRCNLINKHPEASHKVTQVYKTCLKLEGFGYVTFDTANFKLAHDPLLDTKDLEDYL